MAPAKFLHAADLHLGAPLKSLGDLLDAETHERMVALVNTAFSRLVDIAIAEEVDFVVLAGDVYDNADRDPGARRRVLTGLRRLTDAGIRVFMVHGNHDPLTRDVAEGSLPEGVVVFPAGRLGSEVVTMRNGVDVVVAGVSYGKIEETENLVPLFADLTGRTIVGVLHTNVGGNALHGNYAPSSVAELESSPVHYWALGHIHMRSVNRTRNGWWAYPGNLQGRSRKAAECGPKGALIVEVDDDGRILEPRFVECSALRFERVEVSVDGIDDSTLLNDRVNEALAAVVSQAGDVPVLVRLELVGPTDLRGLRDPESSDWNSISSSLLEEAAEVLGDGAVIRLLRSCTPRIDLDKERLDPSSLLGNVLRAVDAVDVEPETKDAAIAILVNTLGASR